MGILGRGTPEEVGRVLERRVLEGKVLAPLVVVDKGGMGPTGLGPDMVEGFLGSSRVFKVYLSSSPTSWSLFGSRSDGTRREPPETSSTCFCGRKQPAGA